MLELINNADVNALEMINDNFQEFISVITENLNKKNKIRWDNVILKFEWLASEAKKIR